jgi:PAS domain S-box-containing protein
VAVEGGPLRARLTRLLRLVVESLGPVDTAALFRLEGGVLRLRAVVGLREDELDRLEIPLGTGFAGRIAAERRPLTLPFAAGDPSVLSPSLQQRQVRALHGVPLLAEGRVVGVATIGSLAEYAFPSLTLKLFRDIADRLAIDLKVAEAHDALDRARRDATLRAAVLDAALEAAPVGVVIYDRAGAILQMNRAARAGLGYDEQAAGLPMEERLRRLDLRDEHERPLAAEETPAGRAFRGETVVDLVLRVRTADGKDRLISAAAAPIHASAEEIAGVVATYHDVTAVHRLNEQVQNLVRVVSHDLRTPLGVVLLQGELLARSPDAATARRGATIKSAAQRMGMLVQDMVDLARVETRQLRLDLVDLDLRAWVGEAVATLAGVLPTGRLRVEVAPDVPRVRADPGRLERVLANLLSNAVKYSPAESGILLAAARHELGARLSVTDAGRGIPADELPKVFDRYYRAPGAATYGEGLGLGLFITRQLVEAHGGRIWAESEAGRGSTFHVVLPAAGGVVDENTPGP